MERHAEVNADDCSWQIEAYVQGEAEDGRIWGRGRRARSRFAALSQHPGIEGVQGPVKKMADYSEDNQSFSMDEGIEGVQGPVKKMADYGEDNQSFSMDEEIEGVQGGGQNMLGCCEVNSSFSIDEERIEGIQEGGQDITGHEIANPSFSVDKEIMDQNCDTTTIEDFANPPLKKIKIS